MCSDGFRAVSNHLVLLLAHSHQLPHDLFQNRVKSSGSSTISQLRNAAIGFRAVSNHPVLLQRKHGAGSSMGFRAVSNHLVLLPADLAAPHVGVSQPCQITWFSYPGRGREVAQAVSEPCQITWFSYTNARLFRDLVVS